MVTVLVKTVKGLENIAASRIEEELEDTVKCLPKPYGFLGLVLVEAPDVDPVEVAGLILNRVEEVEKALPIMAETRAEITEIAKAAAEVTRQIIERGESFAVRTTRRGQHSFTSIDVNMAAGAAVKEATGAEVNLSYPDKIVWIEILKEKAYISVTGGEVERRKLRPGKPLVENMLRKFAIAQMPYTGPLDAARAIGVRIGRAVQTFEIRELYITPIRPVEAAELTAFLKGVLEGRRTRLEIQRKTYARRPREVPVYVQDLYQFFRDRRGEPIIVTSTRGDPLPDVSNQVAELFTEHKRVNIVVGAREGIPTGLFRHADLVIDLSPNVTISTDFAAVAAIVGIVTVLEKEGVIPRYDKRDVG